MLNPYLLNEVGEFEFTFCTQNGILYNAVFISYADMFYSHAHIAHKIYTFNLDILCDEIKTTHIDERIGQTIAVIFNKFFENDEHAVIYLCDSLDDRQLARKRKFDYWFWKYSKDTIVKEDGYAIVEGVEILSSVIMRSDNPYFNDILFAFAEINRNAEEK